MSTPTGKYPFDPEKYSRGDLVPIDDIEHAYGVRRDHSTYRLAQMQFREVLYRYFGGIVPIRCVGKGLYILPPNQEQVDYFFDDVAKCRRRITRRLAETASVNPELVDDGEMQRMMEAQARISWLNKRLLDRKWTPPPLPPPPKQIEGGEE